ncbi:MAG: hypothetical protein ACO1OB_06285 [Archangium sp.]
MPTLPELVLQGEGLRGAQPASWPWFLEEVRRRGAPFAKVQVPGPASGLRDATEQAVGYTRALLEVGVQPLVFIDEPVLSAGSTVGRVLGLRDSLRGAGAIVGLHCCGNTDWASVLDAQFDLVSFDARLSLEAVMQSGAWDRFVSSEARLALGIVPTSAGGFEIDERCASVEVLLRATGMFPAILERVLLTPACGLGLFEPHPAALVVGHLQRAQSVLRAAR